MISSVEILDDLNFAPLWSLLSLTHLNYFVFFLVELEYAGCMPYLYLVIDQKTDHRLPVIRNIGGDKIEKKKKSFKKRNDYIYT